MLKAVIARFAQGYRTIKFPDAHVNLPDRFRGVPLVDRAKCRAGCENCSTACPTGAIGVKQSRVRIDLGRCLFCGDCARQCPSNAISFTKDYRMAARKREDLVLEEGLPVLAAALEENMRRLYGRSLRLRQVSAGGCNACEADVNVLTTIVFDLGRFGIQFVASPRHADGLLITGPVTENMRLALQKTYEAVPPPKLVIACGACAVSGGPYVNHAETHNGVSGLLPVDLFIPGCPPHPLTILDGLLRLVGKIESQSNPQASSAHRPNAPESSVR
ncbi:MAG TPA: NADH-quinone oxidoreductase subunit NuoB [Verrucomicrobiota bacterium]|nr:NADH-quinone oxidoreductase subunit NuoB [Verrucomicrobiota bacterium]